MQLCRAGWQLPVECLQGRTGLMECQCCGRGTSAAEQLQGAGHDVQRKDAAPNPRPAGHATCVMSGGRCVLWQHTGQSQVQHTLQHLQQHQGCASSVCQADFVDSREALQGRLTAARVRPQQMWLQRVCWATRLCTVGKPSASRVEASDGRAARSDQDSACRWECRPNGLSEGHVTWLRRGEAAHSSLILLLAAGLRTWVAKLHPREDVDGRDSM